MPLRHSVLSLWLCLPALAVAAPLQETWQTGYTGPDATGPHVLGYWKFEPGAELKDSSGKGNELVLQGAATGVEGRFGGGLESFPGFPVEDKAHSARASGTGRLSPLGPFTLEMWVKPKPGFEKLGRCYLADKKYVPDNHTDFAWQLGDPDKAGARRFIVTLGLGSTSETFVSPALQLPAGEWRHVAFSYDAAGTVTFYLQGALLGRVTQPGLGAVVAGRRPLHLADRSGSNYGGFPGFVDEVRLCDGALRFEPVDLQVLEGRAVWLRMEQAAPLQIQCGNLQREPLTGARLEVDFAGRKETFPLPDLKAGATHSVKFAVDTALRAGTYKLRASLEGAGTQVVMEKDYQIVPRPPANRMPVIMWGDSPEETERLKEIGFTHCLGLRTDLGEVWSKGEAVPPGKEELITANRRMLDRALAADLGVIASLSPARVLEGRKEFLRVDRAGKPYARQDICASMPELATFFENAGRSVSKAYGSHPALAAVLVDTEVRDASQPSFNPVDVENYRKFAGADIPAEVVVRSGVEWGKLKDFPADRVIPDDHPILKYYRWFWTTGDGWNGLHTALHKGVKSNARRGLWTFFDPAVRQPSISGAGGAVDVISHWTYTYPDPQRIGLCTDQLFAMSEASSKRQAVMKMTQLIWYRSQTAPVKAGGPEAPVPWEDHDPDAAYITIAPMHLREAFWTKISRPIQGIMYHGWQSLVPTQESGSGYRLTNSNTVEVLKELVRDVVRPLGPTLVAVPDERSEVALLESFSSQMFARRGGYGNNNTWSADLWMALQHAHVQTDILYEETLLKNGLSGRRYLFMPDCDVLTQGVVNRLREWQKKGGKIIADENLCPALKADLVIPSFKRVKNAAQDKARVLELAAALGPQVKALGWKPRVTCDNPEIIVRTRRFGDAIYVFVVNDHREAGTYVGQHGLVMENGLPSKGMLGLNQENANVYDLTTGGLLVPRREVDGGVSWPVELGPCGGRIFMVLPRPLLEIRADVAETAKAGNTAPLTVTLTSTQAGPLRAVVPVEIQIRDAGGRAAEGSGFYAAENGVVNLDLNIAKNEEPGVWEIQVRELASGMRASRWMRVTR